MLQTTIGKQVLECVWQKDFRRKIEKCSHFSFEVHVENGLALIAIFHAILPLTRNHSAIPNGKIFCKHTQFNSILYCDQSKCVLNFDTHIRFFFRVLLQQSVRCHIKFEWERETKMLLCLTYFRNFDWPINLIWTLCILFIHLCARCWQISLLKSIWNKKYETWQKQFHYSCFQ